MVKVVHVGDVHLGRPFGFLPRDKAEKVRAAQMAALRNVAALAREEGAAAVLVAGDLFDSNEAPGRLVRDVQEIIRQSGVEFYILPGAGGEGLEGHDGLARNSVYRRESWRTVENAHVFMEERVFYVERGRLAIYGRPSVPGEPVLPRVARDPRALFHIALCHASVQFKSEIEDYPLSYDEIAASGYDYVALGHWHKRQEHSSRGVTAWYAGCPETLEWDRDPRGCALLVTLEEGRVLVEPRVTGEFTWISTTVDVAGDPAGIAATVLSRVSDPARTLVRVKLSGVVPAEGAASLAADVERALAGTFYCSVDASRLRPALEPGRFPPGSIAAEYAGLLLARLAEITADDPSGDRRRRILTAALDKGLQLLTGEMTPQDLDLEVILQ
ncbi:MAG: DNA repair exonuclease [Firmicutes bacterium]|jgi:DNA repair exonuclease SbcCD nuclease subunit|nr:DNA repair exonuclease [Bacillota bacterium]